MEKRTITINNYGGMSFFESWTLLLIALKILGYIDINWGWVFMPMFIGFAVLLIIHSLRSKKYEITNESNSSE